MGRKDHITTMMIFIKNWGYKVKYVIKRYLGKIFNIISTLLTFLGLILSIAEIIYYMFGSKIVYNFMKDKAVLIVVIGVLIGFFKHKVNLQYKYYIKGTDVEMSIQVTDVLNVDAAIVIPTNTTFDTLMENEFISVNSVQGQFQLRYFNNNLTELDDLLAKGLDGLGYEQLHRTKSKNKRYPIGTVSKITVQGKHYYFVAIADINEYGKTENTRFENVQIALEGIWNEVGEKGHIENLALPLIGTGKAGIKDVTRIGVIKEIIFSFVASATERKITEKLIVCVNPMDLNHKDIQLEEIDEYLKYMCKYRYADVNSRTEGIGI